MGHRTYGDNFEMQSANCEMIMQTSVVDLVFKNSNFEMLFLVPCALSLAPLCSQIGTPIIYRPLLNTYSFFIATKTLSNPL